MKIFKSAALILFALITGLFVFSACQKEEDVQTTGNPAGYSKEEQAKISALVDLANKANSTDAEYQAYQQEYQALTPAQFALYEKMDLAKMAQILGNSDEAKLGVRNAELIRSAINRRSQELYGQTYNKLDAEKLNKLYDEYDKGLAAGRVEKVNCPAYQFPSSLTYGPICRLGTIYSYTEAATNTGGDCDCQYEFRATRSNDYSLTRIQGISTKGRSLLALFNNQVAVRKPNVSTYFVLIGKTRVVGVFGSCRGVNATTTDICVSSPAI